MAGGSSFATAQLRLGRAVERDEIGLVVFDQLLDHVAGGPDGSAVYNPKHVRQALVPLRRVAFERNIAAVGLMHPIKGNPRSFRDLLAGSHQFNAASRSSLLLGRDPEGGDHDRILVRGKATTAPLPAPPSSRFAVMSKAGHASMATTKRYLHLAGTVFSDEAEALERRLLGPVG